ncbi:amidohydrolase family protein [Psychrobacillus sp. PGGUH221]|uniref:amidohydrolase family protein n=1 Tax=Psychrobacillus sp. PGGUH221 TaxID=3020058 RepID=UPI0035C76909
MKKKFKLLIFLIILLFVFFLLSQLRKEITIIPNLSYEKDKEVAAQITEMRKNNNQSLLEKYKQLRIIDVHSHDVDALDLSERRNNDNYTSVKDLWSKYGIDQTVLFGAVSDPTAIKSDLLSWRYYEQYPEKIYPSFAGVKIDKDGLSKVKQNLEIGYMHIGELFAAATYSPFASVRWKAKHPNDGNLPEVYDLASEYNVPVLLHIDPPKGLPMQQFELAMKNHPDTTFIFAHGNVHTSPQYLRDLLDRNENLMIDFFSGYTLHNPGGDYKLDDFARIVEEYPDRFVLGSDSGYEIGLENSYIAMYEFIDLLSPKTSAKVAYQNFEQLMERQAPTQEQINLIKKLTEEKGVENKTYHLNKREANELIFTLQKMSN